MLLRAGQIFSSFLRCDGVVFLLPDCKILDFLGILGDDFGAALFGIIIIYISHIKK